ncbi:hypothetical protein AeNC1_012342, partial [Aphanomyces euteiches]
LLQDNEDSQEELRLYDIDLREVVDENSQMTKELRRTQSKIEQLEFARLQDLEGLKVKISACSPWSPNSTIFRLKTFQRRNMVELVDHGEQADIFTLETFQVLESREFKWLNLGLRATQLFGHLGISKAWIQVSCAMLRGSGR